MSWLLLRFSFGLNDERGGGREVKKGGGRKRRREGY